MVAMSVCKLKKHEFNKLLGKIMWAFLAVIAAFRMQNK